MTPDEISAHYRLVRNGSVELSAPLSVEDCCVQSMPDASPVKWHLAHTTWFFETFILERWERGFRPFHEAFRVLYNSYYNAVGDRHPRPQRGLLTQPTLATVLAYRADVDRRMATLLVAGEGGAELLALVALGLQHEQQHQELILTDIKYGLSLNPFDPVYRQRHFSPNSAAAPIDWLYFPGGETTVGRSPAGDFCYDNETPCHAVLLRPYQLADRLTTCGDYLAFMADDAYRRPEFWLSDGWAAIAANDWQAPLYWRQERNGEWSIFTLHGRRPLEPAEPLCHVSFYEVAAYATWAGARLPTEFEWEAAVAESPVRGNFLNQALLHPQPAETGGGLRQAFGDAWVWTRSAYDPYPGFRPLAGAVGEYNGKFMVGQLVLRGGSCASPPGHLRATYRNYFPPAARWQFSGLRLARDA